MNLDIETRTRSLRALAWSVVRDEQLAEDAAQDAWLALLEARTTPRNPVAWVAGATRNLARRTLRTRSRAARRDESAARAEATASTATLAAEAEVLRSIATAVAELEPTYRDVIVMRYYRERTPAEIAEATGLPPATVKTRLRRALEQLRARLHADEEARPWMLVLAPLPFGMGAAMVGVAALLVVALGGWVWSADSDDAPPPRVESKQARADVAAPPSEEPPEPSPNHVIVQGPDGRPVAGAAVRVHSLQFWEDALATVTTGEAGTCDFPISSRAATPSSWSPTTMSTAPRS